MLLTVYGVTVAIGSWCADALSNIRGPRKVMAIGAAIRAVFEGVFLVFGVGQMSYSMMIVGLRNVVIRMGGVGSAIAVPLFFYMPQMFPGDFTVACLFCALYGMMLGVAGIIWIFAGLYALSAVLMIALRDPEGLRDAPRDAAVAAAH